MKVEAHIPETHDAEVRAYWTERRLLRYYTHEQPWTGALVDAILETSPDRVLEFGCNAGRTLNAIHRRAPGVALSGIDLNRRAVEWGRSHWGLDIRVGDQSDLSGERADVAYTVSVIDHIPEPGPVLETLTRVAPTLLLLEPWLGTEGRIAEGAADEWTYSWDYATRLRALGMTVTMRRFPIGEGALHQEYRLFRARRR